MYYTNLEFHDVTNKEDEATIRIEILDDPNAGGDSTVRRAATEGCNETNTMTLPKDAPMDMIRHELFHTLGFLHEHQSPRRPFSVSVESTYSLTLVQNKYSVTLSFQGPWNGVVSPVS